MMELLFENRYCYTKELLKEVYRHVFFKTGGMIFFYIISGIAIAQELYFSLFWDLKFPVYLLLFIPGFYIFRIVQYTQTIKSLLARQQEVSPDKPATVHLSVYADHLRLISASGAEYNLAISQVKKGFTTANTVCLITKAKMMYIFPTNCFTQGTSISFIQFCQYHHWL